MGYPPGLVGVCCGDLGRYSLFAECMAALLRPNGTPPPLWQPGASIADNHNRLIAAMAPEHAWIQLHDDDHLFDADLLLRLLDHNVALVAPLCVLRRPPFVPTILRRTTRGYEPWPWDELEGRHGLLEVDAMGGPGKVIRREVLDAIGPPWFEAQPGARVIPCDEIYFCEKVQAAGFHLYVDLDITISHITSMPIRPRRTPEGHWEIGWAMHGTTGTVACDFALKGSLGQRHVGLPPQNMS